jgi:hypothetical protein
LLVPFIDLFLTLEVPDGNYPDFGAFLADFPRQTLTGAGARANTLIVIKPDGRTLSLRPFYNAIERYYRAEHKRFDFPSAAPHATQAWIDYITWLDALVTFSAEQLQQLLERVNQFVLNTLTSQEFDPSTVEIEPPAFRLLIEAFDMVSRKGEPTGAAFQGLVFGFLWADNPHLQIGIDKIRTGSKRLQRIGDVDGWEGGRLAISAEVKQYELKASYVPNIEGFANAIGCRGALGVVAALSFEDGVRDTLEGMGVIPLDRSDILRIVELWDPVKQRTAVFSLLYYVKHVEMNSSLTARVELFLSTASKEWLANRLGRLVQADVVPVEEL